MCEYVNSPIEQSDSHWVEPNDELPVGGQTITRLGDNPNHKGFWECWHPETQTWEAMYQPPPGMALHMSEGSKIRFNTIDKKPDHTKNPPPPETIEVGTKMRDLIQS